MSIDTELPQSMAKLGPLLMGMSTAMLSTVEKGGRIHCRPMMTIRADPDGVLWFFTKDSDVFAEELGADPQVQLTYSGTKSDTYAVVSGHGELVQDPKKMSELWNPLLKTQYRDELKTAHLGLIRVAIREAEYWEPTSAVVRLTGFVKGLVTGKPVQNDNHHLVVGTEALPSAPQKPPLGAPDGKQAISRWDGEGGNSAPRTAPESVTPPESKFETKSEMKSKSKKTKQK